MVNLTFFHHSDRARVRLVFLNVTAWKTNRITSRMWFNNL